MATVKSMSMRHLFLVVPVLAGALLAVCPGAAASSSVRSGDPIPSEAASTLSPDGRLGRETQYRDQWWQWSLNIGYRIDQLDWNKAGPGVNILSELTWRDIQSIQLAFALERRFRKNYRLKGSMAFGGIFQGKNQDSDYLGNDRTLEFSRSNNSSDDGDLWDLSFGLGYDFFLAADKFHLTPFAGLSMHVQNLTITEGFQTIPPDGPFPGLKSSYDTLWWGPWLGLEAGYSTRGKRLPLGGQELVLGGEYHLVEYDAEGNWNLRPDRQQPKSFEHEADGRGIVLYGRYNYFFDSRWSLDILGIYKRFETDPGIDRNFFVSFPTVELRLNEVNWESWALSVGVSCRF